MQTSGWGAKVRLQYRRETICLNRRSALLAIFPLPWRFPTCRMPQAGMSIGPMFYVAAPFRRATVQWFVATPRRTSLCPLPLTPATDGLYCC